MKSAIYLFSLTICLLSCSRPNKPGIKDTSTIKPNTDNTGVDSKLKRLALATQDQGSTLELKTDEINQLIDSLFASDSADRILYFKALNKVRSQAKGESIEFINWGIFRFSEQYPTDFFENTSDSDLRYYAKAIGEEIATQEESPLDRANEYEINLKKGLNSTFSDKVSLFTSLLYQTIEGRK